MKSGGRAEEERQKNGGVSCQTWDHADEGGAIPNVGPCGRRRNLRWGRGGIGGARMRAAPTFDPFFGFFFSILNFLKTISRLIKG